MNAAPGARPPGAAGATAKVDLKRTLDGYRARPGEFRTLDLSPARYLMVGGRGDPNTAPAYADALAALYPAAYAVKAVSRARCGLDVVVPPLEALWWAPDMTAFTTARDPSRWHWTVMIRVPDWVAPELVDDAVAAAAGRRSPVGVPPVRQERLAEGTCVQTLHVGPYELEAAVLHRLHHEVLPAAGLRMTGRHHEIYLGDPRRAAPERLRTILRQPVAPR